MSKELVQGTENGGNMSMEVAHGRPSTPARVRQTRPKSGRNACSESAGPPPMAVSDHAGAGKVKFIAMVYGADCQRYQQLACWPLDEPKLDSACIVVRSRVKQLIQALPKDTYYYHFFIRVDFVLEYAPDGSPVRTCPLAEMLRTQSGRWMERKGL